MRIPAIEVAKMLGHECFTSKNLFLNIWFLPKKNILDT
jgi:hypothetical protein